MTGTEARNLDAAPTAARKRALFIVITDYPGGAERVTFSLASELVTRPGWEVEVKIVCSQRRDSFSKRVLPSSVKVDYGPLQNWYLSFPFLPLRLLWRRYELVFTTHIYTNALLSLMRKMRLIRTNRLVLRESMSLFDWFSGSKARLLQCLYRMYGAEDLLITQTNYMGEHVLGRLPKRSAAQLLVLPNPISLAAVEEGAAEPVEPELSERLQPGPNVLFCGWLNDRKRPLVALAAFEQALRSGGARQLIFLGSGPLEEEVRQEALRRGLQDRVLLLGHRTNAYAIMAACQYGLLTSAREGFPNVVLEMMACGLRKIVTTPCAGDLEQLPGVTVTRTFDEQEVAEALRQATASGEDCAKTYRSFAATRSVVAYLDAVLDLA